MSLYTYLRKSRYKFLDYFIIFTCITGFIVGLRLLVDSDKDVIIIPDVVGIPAHYLMMGAFICPLFFIHLYNPRKYYIVVSIGFIVSLLFFALQLLSLCDCPVLVKDSISICTWSLILFLMLIILKKIQLAQY